MTDFRTLGLSALIAAIAGFGGGAAWQYSGLGHDNTRAWLVSNPDILPEMAQAYKQQEAQKRLAGVDDQVTTPFPGAILGNPKGTVTLVEFTDYGCGFCKSSRPVVDALIAANPDLRVVIREWPIFDGSEDAARMALAAAKQGKFKAFHDAMFDAGPPSEVSIRKAVQTAGLDMAAAQTFIQSREASFEIAKTMNLAQRLGFSGTPSWVIGNQVLSGAIGKEPMQAAINSARDGKTGS